MADSTRSGQKIQPWHIFGAILAVATTGLVIYGLWPALSGEDIDGQRQATEGPVTTAAPVDVMVLERREFPLRAEATGHLSPWRESKISAETSGLIVDRPVEEGQRVRAGQTVLRLDDREPKILLAEAEAALLQARADYAVQLSNAGEFSVADTSQLR
ncbi:MAG: biotin/lipoyl-binding protein [Bacteroidetes bacterium]|nr:biotin/lipoyl-binding protein [Bacteroidota bacterium]